MGREGEERRELAVEGRGDEGGEGGGSVAGENGPGVEDFEDEIRLVPEDLVDEVAAGIHALDDGDVARCDTGD